VKIELDTSGMSSLYWSLEDLGQRFEFMKIELSDTGEIVSIETNRGMFNLKKGSYRND
jgi:hypothetical protein